MLGSIGTVVAADNAKPGDILYPIDTGVENLRINLATSSESDLRFYLKRDTLDYMQKVNVSTKYIGRFAGKWVAIDPVKEVVIAVGETLRDIDPVVTRPANDPRSSGMVPAAFKVPRRDEGPYILVIR